MVICYSIIFCIVQRRAAQVNEMMQMAENANNENNDGNNEVQIFMRRSTKAAKTLSLVTGVFFLCWLPFFIGMYCSEICIFIEELHGKYSLFLYFSLSLSLSLVFSIVCLSFRVMFVKLSLCAEESSLFFKSLMVDWLEQASQ